MAAPPGQLDALDLCYPKSEQLCPYDDLGLDLESRGLKVKRIKEDPPEGEKSVAEVREVHTEQNVGHFHERPVAQASGRGDVERSSPRNESGTFGEVKAMLQGIHQSWDLLGRHAPIGIHHHEHVSLCRSHTSSKGQTFTGPGLVNDPYVRSHRACHQLRHVD